MIEAEIRELTPQPSAAIRVTQPMSELDLAALFDEHLPNIAHRLADMGVEPAGPPYGRYHEFGPEHVDVEIGIPVDLPVSNFRTYDEAEPGELIASELPGGQVAITIHRGAYDKLSETYDALHDWIHEQGRDEGPGPWESYVDDPGEVAWRTRRPRSSGRWADAGSSPLAAPWRGVYRRPRGRRCRARPTIHGRPWGRTEPLANPTGGMS